jgi:hypothetical protein
MPQIISEVKNVTNVTTLKRPAFVTRLKQVALLTF